MQLVRLDHFTLKVPPSALSTLRTFYTSVLQLREGPRPAFPFPGYWLYAGAVAVVHLAGVAPETSPDGSHMKPSKTGYLDHISLRTTGLKKTREHLASHKIAWGEAPVPGLALHQIFLQDPLGLKIELTFDAVELTDAVAHVPPSLSAGA